MNKQFLILSIISMGFKLVLIAPVVENVVNSESSCFIKETLCNTTQQLIADSEQEDVLPAGSCAITSIYTSQKIFYSIAVTSNNRLKQFVINRLIPFVTDIPPPIV